MGFELSLRVPAASHSGAIQSSSPSMYSIPYPSPPSPPGLLPRVLPRAKLVWSELNLLRQRRLRRAIIDNLTHNSRVPAASASSSPIWSSGLSSSFGEEAVGVPGVDGGAGDDSGCAILDVDVESVARLFCRMRASKSLIFCSNLACEALASSRKRSIPDRERLSIVQYVRRCSKILAKI